MSVVIQNLCKSYDDLQVLQNVDLTVEEKEIVVLMGPSGCGKTTLLRCLCNLETADSGSICINGQYLCKEENNGILYADKKKRQELQKSIGLVFQNYQLFPHRTILRNLIDAPLYHKYMTKQEAIQKAESLLKKLQIFDMKEEYPYRLSGGQKQRAAIARACMLQPSVLCFDEPTSALDAQSIEQVGSIIKELSKDMAILVITHDETFAKNIGTRIVKIKDINQTKN